MSNATGPVPPGYCRWTQAPDGTWTAESNCSTGDCIDHDPKSPPPAGSLVATGVKAHPYRSVSDALFRSTLKAKGRHALAANQTSIDIECQ